MNERLRIAVADDEPDIREFLQRMLPRCGHEVVAAAENGRQLVELADRLKPDLIITDVKMPELDGIEAVRRINVARPTPIVFISAYHDEAQIKQIGAEFLMAYLVKPIVFANLQPAILTALERFRAAGAAKPPSGEDGHLPVAGDAD